MREGRAKKRKKEKGLGFRIEKGLERKKPKESEDLGLRVKGKREGVWSKGGKSSGFRV
jgi:hypothetical protein